MSQFNYQAILDTYRQLMSEANNANEQRYQDILGVLGQTKDTVGQRYDSITEMVNSLGQTQAGRIGQDQVRALATNEQDLINRGLGNTTIRTTTQRGINEDASRALRESQEAQTRQQAAVLQDRAGAEERMGNTLAQFMEARTDKGPDLGMFVNLLNQAGQAQAQSQPTTIFTGLSANARAGLDAFGQPFSYTGTSGTPGGGNAGFQPVTGGSSGGSSGGVTTVRNPNVASSGVGGGTSISNATQAAAGGLVRNPNPNPNDAGKLGSSFDNLFLGQPVMSGGGSIGTYTGGQTYNLNPNTNVLNADNQVDPNRISSAQGGNQQSMDQVTQMAKSILQSTANGMMPDSSYIDFMNKYGVTPNEWMRTRAA